MHRECIDAEKVFDYVIVGGTGSEEVEIMNLDGASKADICTKLNDGGTVRNVETVIDFDTLEMDACSAMVVGTDNVEMDDEEEIELQIVQITKEKDIPILVTFDVYDKDGNEAYKDVTGTGTISADKICEEPVMMCCPGDAGTELSCRIVPSSFHLILAKCVVVGDALKLNFLYTFTICQEVQCSAMVKLEIMARPCRPRPVIRPTRRCRPTPMPNPCRRIFPVPHDDDDSDM
ncbi:hypothetical protein [Halobacillus litoralis]|uniref:hypothetical protein n=1 Tax=Halobacillus litoralis TaxID=45668 RepID=UPI001CFEFE26|nr:hypothetical protein [Halobacillus litoralis]